VAEYIQPDNQREEVYACLFPGEHKVIYSDAGLRSALSRAGFPYVQIEKRRSSNWVIIASLDRDYEAIYDRADLEQLCNEQYKAYLQKVLEGGLVSTSTQQQRVKLALCFRLTKYLVNKGQLDEALQVLAQWYGAFAMLADPELSHSAIHDLDQQQTSADLSSRSGCGSQPIPATSSRCSKPLRWNRRLKR
jgi:hypothetical protein